MTGDTGSGFAGAGCSGTTGFSGSVTGAGTSGAGASTGSSGTTGVVTGGVGSSTDFSR